MSGSLSQLVQQFESGGNYTATNPTSTASGAYQFTNGTWQQYASEIGVDLGLYPTAASAPPALQDAVFAQAVNQNGLNDWTCPNCDPALVNYLNGNPGSGALPLFANGSTSAAANGGTGTAATNASTPTTTGSQTSPDTSASANTSGCTGWIGTPVACITATLTELGLILLALIVLGIGLYMLKGNQ